MTRPVSNPSAVRASIDRSAATAPNNQRKPDKQPKPQPSPDQLAYSIDDVKRLGGPGRTKTYELIRRGVLRRIHIDGSTHLVGDSVRQLLRNGCPK